MPKLIKYIIYSSVLLLVSCTKDWLEVKADQQMTVPSTLADFQALLDYLAIWQQNPALGEIASDLHYVKDPAFQAATQKTRTDAYIWSKTGRHENNQSWTPGYKKILTINTVLEGLTKINPSSAEQDRYNDIKGQALLVRARVYFELAQLFAPPFDSSTSNQNLGIVLRKEADVSMPSQRSSIQETYDQILADAKEAINLLPDKPFILTRGSKTAAFALLSRIYLSLGDYSNALAYAAECIALSPDLLDYNTLSKDKLYIGRYNKEVLMHTNFVDGFLTSSCFIENTFVEEYVDDDLRKIIFFRSNADGSYTFKGNYENLTSNLFNGLAIDEVYLTRAECYARLNKVTEAMADLNKLMQNRWDNNVAYPGFIATDPDEALAIILRERKKELILRGVRWMDLRRLNKDPRFAVTLQRTVLGQTYTLKPNSYKYTLPIPDDVLERSGIKQNPGWEL